MTHPDRPNRDPTSADAETTDADRVALASLILELRSQGCHDRRVLGAIESVPRRLFLGARHQKLAYADRAIPIDCGQTISQPTVVYLMTEALSLEPASRVLEIGTGSGYQAAVLSRLCAHVFTIERYRSLALLAEERQKALKIDTVSVRVGDGTLGWPEEAPFDGIIVTAATREVPEALFAQLGERGVLVAPVGRPHGIQRLMRYERTPGGLAERRITDVRFVPLVAGVAGRL